MIHERSGRYHMICPKCEEDRDFKFSERQGEHYQSMIGSKTDEWDMECIKCGYRTVVDCQSNPGR